MSARQEKPGIVRELRPGLARKPERTDAELVAAIRKGVQSGMGSAAAALFDRYGKHVERLLFSVLGPESEIEDLLHEVFVRALEGIGDIEDPSRLRSWLTGIAVHTAREWIRRRVRRRWLFFVDDVPETPYLPASAEIGEATRDAFEVLRGMGADERVFFSLRFIEGMEMAEIAVACDVSVSTAKRRLKEAEKHFLARARRFPALEPWIQEGRWAAE